MGASFQVDRAVAQEGEPSPFTRAGPGAAGGIKPDVLHHGGNWALNDVDLVEHNDFGVSAISIKGGGERPYFGVANGTSYAAPLVTRVAARILNRYPSSRANLLRALIGASAQPLLLPDPLDAKKRRRLAGYGSLSEHKALESGGNRVALMYQGEIAMDTVVAHPIPIPREFMEASGDRRVIVALAFDPEVRRTRRDYLTATMKFHLVRGMAMDEIESIWQIQPQEKDDRLPLPNDRRRPDLVPGSGECLGATLQVRSFNRRNTDVLDNEGFHVVVEHRTATWYEVEEGDRQRYALVVVLEDQEREGVDLRALVEAQLPIEPEVEVEPRLRVRG